MGLTVVGRSIECPSTLNVEDLLLEVALLDKAEPVGGDVRCVEVHGGLRQLLQAGVETGERPVADGGPGPPEGPVVVVHAAVEVQILVLHVHHCPQTCAGRRVRRAAAVPRLAHLSLRYNTIDELCATDRNSRPCTSWCRP